MQVNEIKQALRDLEVDLKATTEYNYTVIKTKQGVQILCYPNKIVVNGREPYRSAIAKKLGVK